MQGRMTVSLRGIDLVTQSEGLRLEAYRKDGDVWTIGYGHTHGVVQGMRITKAEAIVLLRGDLQWAIDAVNRWVRVPLTQNQFDALVDFVFNFGEPEFRDSQLLLVLNQGHYDQVPTQLRRWVNLKGRKLQGLVDRREREIKFWITPDDNPPQPPAAAQEAA